MGLNFFLPVYYDLQFRQGLSVYKDLGLGESKPRVHGLMINLYLRIEITILRLYGVMKKH